MSPWPKEIQTELVTRHGTVRYVQSWNPDRQLALWEEYQHAPHPQGTEVLPASNKPKGKLPQPLNMYVLGATSQGFLTCPDHSMVIMGFLEYMQCLAAMPVRSLRAVPDEHALDFAFVQPQWTQKSLACGVPNLKASAPAFFEHQGHSEGPVPAIPSREAGPVPDRLELELPSPP